MKCSIYGEKRVGQLYDYRIEIMKSIIYVTYNDNKNLAKYLKENSILFMHYTEKGRERTRKG